MCGLLDDSDTVYSLSVNINSSGTCITVEADYVTVDCQGHTINYSQSAEGYGVYVSGYYEGIVVRNCNIVQGSQAEDSYPIYLVSSSYSVIHNNNLTSNGSYGRGVYLISVDDSNLTNNNISTHGYESNGIHTQFSSGNRISNNIISAPDSDSYDVIVLDDESDYNTIRNNLLFGGGFGANGITLTTSVNNTILNNTINVSGAYAAGVYSNDYYQNVLNNTIFGLGNYSYGIFDSYGSSNFSGNIITISGLGSYGIYLSASTNLNVSNNSVRVGGPSSYALLMISNASNNTISGSGFRSLQSYAAYMAEGDDGVPYRNFFYNNLLNGSSAAVGFSSAARNSLNFWNTTNRPGTRIYSTGTNIGGNYYTNSSGTGFSDTCTDANNDTFCDSSINLSTNTVCSGASCGNNADYLSYSGGASCELGGNYAPCGTVNLSEVVSYIQLWIAHEVSLANVVRLIQAWVGGSGT
jgi:hypothetical protein